MVNSYRFNATRYGSIRSPDLYSNRDVNFGGEPPTPNQFSVEALDGGVLRWELVVNDLSGGLGRVRGRVQSLPNRVQGEISGASLDDRYVDSLHLPVIQRRFTEPALTTTAPSDPTVRATDSNSGTDTSPIGNKPTGTTDGDVLIAYVIHDDASTTISAVPSGWSEVRDAEPGVKGDFVVTVYSKVAASEGSTWTWTLSASERWRVIVVAVQDASAAGPSGHTGKYVTASAQRFYLQGQFFSTSFLAVTPDSAWDNTDSFHKRHIMHPNSQGIDHDLGNAGVTDDDDHSDKDYLCVQYQSQALAAQTITAQSFEAQMRAMEEDNNNQLFLTYCIRVVSGDGLTVRGTVLALTRDDTELATALTNRRFTATTSAVVAQAGDILVVEIGVGGDPNTSSANHNATLSLGDDAASDLPENDTSTSDLNPWIEFANAIDFGAGGAIAVSPSVARAGSLVLTLAAVDEDARTFTGVTGSGGSISEVLDSAANNISAALYSEAASEVGSITHTVTRSAGTTDIAVLSVVIPPAIFGKRASHVNLFGRHAIAVGDADLIRETDALTPVLESIAYSPPSTVNQIVPVIIGGNTARQRLAVLMAADPITLLDDLSSTPVVNGTTMEANTEPAFGLIQTSLFENDIQVYAKNAIRIGSRNGAIGQTLTTTLSNVPNGGGAIGELWIPGSDLRTYWLFPLEDCGTEQAETRNIPMKVTSLNLFGDDPQDLDVPLWAGSGGPGGALVTAAIWQQGLLVTDGFRIVFHTGQNNILNWPGERPGLGVFGQLVCRGFRVRAHQLRILVERVAIAGGSGNTLYWEEEYDERTGKFHQVSPVVDAGSVGSLVGLSAVGSFPVSKYSNIGYWHDDSAWTAQLMTDLLRNPAVEFSGVTGAGDQYGFEETASATTPELILPAGKLPSVVTDIEFIGNAEAGGDDATVTVSIANQDRNGLSFDGGVSATFRARDSWEAHHKGFPTNMSAFDRLQVRVTATRGAETNKTPECVPFIVRGLTFTDRQVKRPIEVLGQEWARRFR